MSDDLSDAGKDAVIASLQHTVRLHEENRESLESTIRVLTAHRKELIEQLAKLKGERE